MLKVSVRQIKAARMLLDWSQDRLAEAAGVGIATIKRLEAQDNGLGGRDDTVSKIVGTLESAGIEFTNGGEPGVKLRAQMDRRELDRSNGFQSEPARSTFRSPRKP